MLNLFFIGGGILTLLMALRPVHLTAWDYLKYGFLNGFSFLIFGFGNNVLADWIDKYLPWTGNIVLRLVVSILATIAYTSVAWVFIVWTYILFEDGNVMSLPSLLKVLPKNMNSFYFSQLITFFVSVVLHGRTFLLGWRQSSVEAERLKKERIAAQYETLKNQVNPHFLFNSLNVLTALVHKDADLAERFIKQLSNVYRYVLESRDKEVVPLSEEIEQLEAYIFLMKIRFGESLKVNIDAPDLDGHIAPLTLQMLVENALKHNEVSRNHPLSIDVFLAENAWIVVKNSIKPRNSVGESTGVGLENIRSRYKFLSQKEVVISQNDGFFTVKIPII